MFHVDDEEKMLRCICSAVVIVLFCLLYVLFVVCLLVVRVDTNISGRYIYGSQLPFKDLFR
jgi:hypothetical protein